MEFTYSPGFTPVKLITALPFSIVALNFSSPILMVTFPVASAGTYTITVPLFKSSTMNMPSISVELTLDTVMLVMFVAGAYFSLPL